MGTLSFYEQDTQQLLRDSNYLWIAKNQMVRFINESRRQIAQRTGCIRRLISGNSAFGASAQPGQIIPGAMQPGALPGAFPAANLSQSVNSFQTILNAERYPFQGFANPYLQQQHAGCESIIDVGDISISWQGSFRPTLEWMPWDDLQAVARAYNNLVTSYPVWWSCYSDGEFGEVWLFPVPSGVMEMEWDCYCIPKDLNSDNDFDAIPPGFRNAVKFKAAELAFFASQRYAQSEIMAQQFDMRIGSGAVARDRGKSPTHYPTVL